MKFNCKAALGCILVMSLAACANGGGTYEPIVDGATHADYENDLLGCQQLATQKDYVNGDVKSEALLGALLGGLSDGGEGAVAGALVGGGARAWEVRDERKSIVMKCLELRGYRVVG